MNDTASIQRWREEAQQLEGIKALNIPLRILIGEAVEVSKFADKYWSPTDKRPGLKSAGPKLPETIAEDILSLREAVQDAQTAYLLVVEPKLDTRELMERSDFVLGEMTAALEWLLDDGVEDDADLQFASLQEAHKDDTGSADSVAQALHDYATLAESRKDGLADLGGFDVAVIDEAFDLARKLGEVRLGGQLRSEQIKEALDLRNRLATLLQQRMRLVRAAARFVFRDRDDIIKEATSAYERRRRAAQRRAEEIASEIP